MANERSHFRNSARQLSTLRNLAAVLIRFHACCAPPPSSFTFYPQLLVVSLPKISLHQDFSDFDPDNAPPPFLSLSLPSLWIYPRSCFALISLIERGNFSPGAVPSPRSRRRDPFRSVLEPGNARIEPPLPLLECRCSEESAGDRRHVLTVDDSGSVDNRISEGERVRRRRRKRRLSVHDGRS